MSPNVPTKSLILILLAALIVLGVATFMQTVLPNVSQAGNFGGPASYLSGDLNGDGSIGSDDVIILRGILDSSDYATLSQQNAGDFNGDGELDSGDLLGLEDFVVMSGGDVRRCQNSLECGEGEICDNGICGKKTNLPGGPVQKFCLCNVDGPRQWKACGEDSCLTCCTSSGGGGGTSGGGGPSNYGGGGSGISSP